MTTECPVLFNAAMVREVLADRKTVTRRLISNVAHGQHFNAEHGWHYGPDMNDCKHVGPVNGGPRWGWGDDWMAHEARCPFGVAGDRLWVRECWAPNAPTWADRRGVVYRADHPDARSGYEPARWRPSIHMPRWASRLTLDVVSVRAERLHNIDDADAIREGFKSREDFAETWRGIYGAASWDANPWVWRVEFSRVHA